MDKFISDHLKSLWMNELNKKWLLKDTKDLVVRILDINKSPQIAQKILNFYMILLKFYVYNKFIFCFFKFGSLEQKS